MTASYSQRFPSGSNYSECKTTQECASDTVAY